MTIQEKIELAEEEVTQAERMIKHTRAELTGWENKYDLRRETLEQLKSQLEVEGKLKPRKAAK